MTFMSLFEIIASISMALATIPMPKNNVYHFSGPVLGNFSTCAAQGYLIVLGTTTAAAFNMSLSWYYVCSICFKMESEIIKKHIEPIFFAFPVILGFTLSSIVLHFEYLNAMPFDSFCTIGPYPFDCTFNDDVECERGGRPDGQGAWNYNMALLCSSCVIGFIFLGINVAMIIIIFFTIKNGRQIKLLIKKQKVQEITDKVENGDINAAFKAEEDMSTTSYLRSTRRTVLQALMYILAFFLTWVFVLSDIISPGGDARSLSVLKVIFLPLQGFWNMLIFLHHKIWLVRNYDSTATIWDAIMIVFSKNKNVPPDNLHVLSNIDMVEKDLLQIVGEASPSKINSQGSAVSRQIAEGNNKTANFFADEERRRSMKIASSGDNSRSMNAGIESDRCEEEGDLEESQRSLYEGVSYASPHSFGGLGGVSSTRISAPSQRDGVSFQSPSMTTSVGMVSSTGPAPSQQPFSEVILTFLSLRKESIHPDHK